MSIHRFRLVRPIEVRKIDLQIAAGINASVVGQSPDLVVDIDLSDDAALADLQAYMGTLGWAFVETDPTSPRPVLPSQVQSPVISRLGVPPGGPGPGDRYIVAVGASGAWVGRDNDIAEWNGTGWQFTTPAPGMTTWDETEQESDVWSGSWEAAAPRELGVWTARDAVLTAASPPALVVRNNREMLSYPDGSLTVAYFEGVVPRSYVPTGPIRAKINWVAETATSGACRWQIAFERMNANGPNVDTDNFAANKSFNNNANATNGVMNAPNLNFDNAEADGIEPGNPFRVRVQRAGAAAGDTMVGAAQLMRLVITQ